MPKSDETPKHEATESLAERAKEYGRKLIDKATPSVMKPQVRLKAYDDAVNEAVRGRQTTDSNN